MDNIDSLGLDETDIHRDYRAARLPPGNRPPDRGARRRTARRTEFAGPGERELIAAYVSALNDGLFCCNAHSAFAAAQLDAGMPLIEQVCADLDTAPLSPKLRALLRMAAAVQRNGQAVTPEPAKRRAGRGRHRRRSARHRPHRGRILHAEPVCGRTRGLSLRSDPSRYQASRSPHRRLRLLHRGSGRLTVISVAVSSAGAGLAAARDQARRKTLDFEGASGSVGVAAQPGRDATQRVRGGPRGQLGQVGDDVSCGREVGDDQQPASPKERSSSTAAGGRPGASGTSRCAT